MSQFRLAQADGNGSLNRRDFILGATALGMSMAAASALADAVAAQDATPVALDMPTLSLSDGAMIGAEENGVVSFKGIPYAAPPVGNFRWREPQPVEPWQEPLDATDFCPDCMQAPGNDDLQTTPAEACLCLNIWKPATATAGDGLPVLVWIHGGGYVGGGTSTPICDGSGFASQGLVVVSLNYRLSRFGFFAHPALYKAAEGAVGNFGYMDQIRALEWVRDNIEAFGGDASRVTLMGESAGGASVLHLVTSPVVGDLFQQAVVLSGGGREAILVQPLESESLTRPGAKTRDAAFGLTHGVVGDGAGALAKLREIDPSEITGDGDLMTLGLTQILGGTPSGVPIIDGTIVVGQPGDHFLSGDARHIPIIIGTTAIDVPLIFPPDKVRPLSWFGEDKEAARTAYGVQDKRFLGPEALVKLILSIGTDMTMHEPAHFVASAMKEAGQPAWVYRFTYTAESVRPEQTEQVHASELPFLFDTLSARYGDDVTASDQATATAFHTYVGNFAKNGDPNGAGLPEWPQVAPAAFDVMNFTLEDGPVYGADPRPSVELVSRARARHDGGV